MKKTKFLVAAIAVVTVSGGLLSFASANEGSKKEKNVTLEVIDNTSSIENSEPEVGWAVAWSSNHSGILAWE